MVKTVPLIFDSNFFKGFKNAKSVKRFKFEGEIYKQNIVFKNSHEQIIS